MSRGPHTSDASTAAGAAVVEAVFHPRSVAVVGASANPDSPGHDYVRSLLDFGYQGAIHPINPRTPEILGLRAYPSLRDVPGTVDYVICCIPAEGIPDLVEECREKGVKVLQLFTGRFSETGRREGARLEEALRRRARAAGVRVIGPNCMGVYHPAGGLSFRPDLPREPGAVALLSQSGNNAVELVRHAAVRGLRFGKVVSYGNAADLDESDFLAYLARDRETEVIGAYVEGVRDGRRLLLAVRAAAAAKPVVVLKAGRTAAGARSAVSHTAALVGSHRVWSGALRQAGAVQVDTTEEAIDMLVAFAFLHPGRGLGRRPAGRTRRPAYRTRWRVGVVGGGGGRSVQSADACEEAGLRIVPLPGSIRRALREKAPHLWDWVGNPVDQSILAGGPVSGAAILAMMAASPAFDVLIANLGEDWILGRPDAEQRLEHVTARFVEVASSSRKPLAFVLGPADSPEEWRWRAIEGARQRLAAARLAVYPTIERAAWALSRWLAYLEERRDL
jgi:acyl-CoA synthetase (NDP forming)